jgi:hypothetical protein
MTSSRPLPRTSRLLPEALKETPRRPSQFLVCVGCVTDGCSIVSRRSTYALKGCVSSVPTRLFGVLARGNCGDRCDWMPQNWSRGNAAGASSSCRVRGPKGRPYLFRVGRYDRGLRNARIVPKVSGYLLKQNYRDLYLQALLWAELEDPGQQLTYHEVTGAGRVVRGYPGIPEARPVSVMLQSAEGESGMSAGRSGQRVVDEGLRWNVVLPPGTQCPTCNGTGTI